MTNSLLTHPLWLQELTAFPQVGTVLAHRTAAVPRAEHDAQQLAESRGWIFRYAPGRWFYGGELLRLIRSIQTRTRSIARRFDFEEWIFPRCLTQETAERFGLPQNMPQSLVRLATREGGVLDPVQCAPFYDLLQLRATSTGVLPLRIFESGGPTFRNEPPERLSTFATAHEFIRAEFVFAGSPSDARLLRLHLLDALSCLFTALDLEWRIVVGAGCFDGSNDSAPRLPSSLHPTGDVIPVIDIELRASAGSYIEAVGGALLFDSKIPPSVSAAPEQLGSTWSGCVGAGVNRIAFACLAQLGSDLGAVFDTLEAGA